jgi:hypothetical protein
LVATDCHLGYLEKDEVRRNDSFNAFDEICSIASQRQVFAQSSLPFSAVPLHLYMFDCYESLHIMAIHGTLPPYYDVMEHLFCLQHRYLRFGN